MKAERILLGQEGRRKVLEGIEILANTIRHLYGTGQSHASLDGKSFVSKIELLNALQNVGSSLAKKAAEKTLACCGDGSLLTVLITESIIKNLLSQEDLLFSLSSLEKATCQFFTLLNEERLQTFRKEELLHIATSNAGGDFTVAKTTVEALLKVHPEGTLVVAPSREKKSVEVKEALCLDSSQLAFSSTSYLCSPAVLCSDKVVQSPLEILSFLPKSRKLLLIAENVTSDALASIQLNARQGLLDCMILTLPKDFPHRSELFHVLQKKTISEVIADKAKVTIVADPPLSVGPFTKKVAILPCSEENQSTYEKCVASCQEAVGEGVVAGVASALFHVSMRIDLLNSLDEERVGLEILKDAAEAPLKTLIQNAKLSYPQIAHEMQQERLGFHFETKKVTNLAKDGIIEPIKMIKTAFHNAIEVAKVVARCEVVLDMN